MVTFSRMVLWRLGHDHSSLVPLEVIHETVTKSCKLPSPFSLSGLTPSSVQIQIGLPVEEISSLEESGELGDEIRSRMRSITSEARTRETRMGEMRTSEGKDERGDRGGMNAAVGLGVAASSRSSEGQTTHTYPYRSQATCLAASGEPFPPTGNIKKEHETSIGVIPQDDKMTTGAEDEDETTLSTPEKPAADEDPRGQPTTLQGRELLMYMYICQ